MPRYVVKGRAAIIRFINEERVIDAKSPAAARARFRCDMSCAHGGSVSIQSCIEEAEHAIQGSLGGGSDRPH
jgi:hypothetical protein